jgi:competence ComEA-like helix-hairpin-helix protein
MLKRIIRDYFYFSKRERNALLLLLLITGAFYVWPYFYEVKRDPPLTDVELLAVVKQLQQDDRGRDNYSSSATSSSLAVSEPVKMFVFDPNTLDEDGFVRLGLPARTARTIINYRNKGGRFRKPDDLRKIYTLRPEDADRLVPYAQIAGMQQALNGYTLQRSEARPSIRIDVNTADALTLEQLPGIGKVLSERIVRYREALGGFYSVQQLKEVSGIHEQLFEQIRPQLILQSGKHQQWSLAKVTKEQLSQHPYCSKATAEAIIRFRQEKGLIRSVEELKAITEVSPDILARLLPYLKTDTD